MIHTLLQLIGAIVLFGQLQAQAVRVEENFDKVWLFARYGLQPDGSRKPVQTSFHDERLEKTGSSTRLGY